MALAAPLPRFVVVGGGVAGALYVRQLLRAIDAGRLAAGAIHVVDRDPACLVARGADARVRLETAEWEAWLDARLEAFHARDHFVPYHWAPHLLLDWLARQARRHGAKARRATAPGPLGLPFERVTRDGDRALSYATWACPPTCIEPALCPHTRGPKHWSLAGDLESAAAPLEALVLRCLHLVYGVATIPVARILSARERILGGLAHGPRNYLVATSSHCHALASVLEVAPGVREAFGREC
jgi:hypothetical protein